MQQLREAAIADRRATTHRLRRGAVASVAIPLIVPPRLDAGAIGLQGGLDRS